MEIPDRGMNTWALLIWVFGGLTGSIILVRLLWHIEPFGIAILASIANFILFLIISFKVDKKFG